MSDGESPGLAREVLDAETTRVERVLLRLRLVEGLDLAVLDDVGRKAVGREVDAGLLDPVAAREGRAVLTLAGRLLADAVVRRLLG